MTPIKSGTAQRLGLRKPPPSKPHVVDGLRRADRLHLNSEVVATQDGVRVVNSYLWRAVENGFVLEWVTTNEDLVVYSMPVNGGAMLVDQDCRHLIGQAHWW